MITIDQLLESVDLDFEPRFVTKDKNCEIWIWNSKPVKDCNWHIQRNIPREFYGFFITNKIKLSEFEGKDWTECIYEVTRKTTGKIEKVFIPETDVYADSAEYSIELAKRLNQVIDAVNELKGANNG